MSELEKLEAELKAAQKRLEKLKEEYKKKDSSWIHSVNGYSVGYGIMKMARRSNREERKELKIHIKHLKTRIRKLK